MTYIAAGHQGDILTLSLEGNNTLKNQIEHLHPQYLLN